VKGISDPELIGFIQHIGEHPEEKAPKLVFSDWLQERESQFQDLWEAVRWIARMNSYPKLLKRRQKPWMVVPAKRSNIGFPLWHFKWWTNYGQRPIEVGAHAVPDQVWRHLSGRKEKRLEHESSVCCVSYGQGDYPTATEAFEDLITAVWMSEVYKG